MSFAVTAGALAVVGVVVAGVVVLAVRTLVIVVFAPNVVRSVAMSASFFCSALFSASTLLPLSRSLTFTSCTFAADRSVIALILSLCADVALIAEMREPKLGAIATSPFEVVVGFWACESYGVAIAATAAAAKAVRRVRVCIGDSCTSMTRSGVARTPLIPRREPTVGLARAFRRIEATSDNLTRRVDGSAKPARRS